MIKLIFTSLLLVGSLFFFQSNLQERTNPKLSSEEVSPVSVKPVERQEIILEHGDNYIDIKVKNGDQIKVIRQYYFCNT